MSPHTKQRRRAIRNSPFVHENSERDNCEALLVIVSVVLTAAIIAVIGFLFVSCAQAGEDNFGRHYDAGASYSADVEQIAGFRLWSIRAEDPDNWIELKVGKDTGTANVGVIIAGQRNFSYVVGLGAHVDDGVGVNAHLGGMKTVGKLAIHGGYDTNPGSFTVGIGWLLW